MFHFIFCNKNFFLRLYQFFNIIIIKKIFALFQILFKKPIFFGIGGKSIVLKIADTNIPNIEIVNILEVKIGRLKDKTVKLKLFPPKRIGSHPSKNSKRAAVAQDQNPSKIV